MYVYVPNAHRRRQPKTKSRPNRSGFAKTGGDAGIRTPGGLAPSSDFKSGALNQRCHISVLPACRRQQPGVKRRYPTGQQKQTKTLFSKRQELFSPCQNTGIASPFLNRSARCTPFLKLSPAMPSARPPPAEPCNPQHPAARSLFKLRRPQHSVD